MVHDKTGHWLSCDWGTSTLRIRVVEKQSLRIIEEVKVEKGIAEVYGAWKKSGKPEDHRIGFYYQMIQQQIQLLKNKNGINLHDLLLVISGMASSTIGMINVPYKMLPFAADGSNITTHRLIENESQREILIISGVTSGEDIMRGEETLLIGCAENIDIATQLYIFPGTHSKHVFIKDSKVVDFKTYMTGEFFWLLTDVSVLGSGIKKSNRHAEKNNQAAFAKGVEESRNNNLLHSCFNVRTNTVLQKCSPEENYFYLSGLLIGTELQNAMKTSGITVAGDPMFNGAYSKALELLQYEDIVRLVNGEEALVKGQWRIMQNEKCKI